LRSDASADDRATWLLLGACATAAAAVPSVYPRNFPIHRLPIAATPGESPPRFPPLPKTTWLSGEKLEQDGIYLLEDGREMSVWVGKQASAPLLRDVFGVDHADHIASTTAHIPRIENASNASVNEMVNCMRKMRSSYMRTRIYRRGDIGEHSFYQRLIEDRSAAGMSYVEFLCHVHRLIQNKFQ
jgi:protein transport protein SEC24